MLNTTEEEELNAISTSVKKAVYVLRKISSSLQAGQTQTFYSFLKVVEEYGNAASIQVVHELKREIKYTTGMYTVVAVSSACMLLECVFIMLFSDIMFKKEIEV